GADLGDAGVATGTLRERRGDLLEQRVDDTLVTDGLHDAATGGEITLLRLGDEALGVRAQALRLGLGGGDRLVAEQLGGETGDDHPLVSGGSAEPRALGGCRHGRSP